MKRFLLVGVAAILTAGLSAAQDEENEVEGTVSQVNDWSLEIKAGEETVTVNVRYIRGGEDWVRDDEQKAALQRRVREGARVWVRFSTYKGEKYIQEYKVLGGGNTPESPEVEAETVSEGRVLRLNKRAGRVSLVVLIDGIRRELAIPKIRLDGRNQLDPELLAQASELRTGYFVGVGYSIEDGNLVLKWVFLVRGGKVDRTAEWEDKRKAWMGKEKDEDEKDEEEKEWERRREKKEHEREKNEEKEREEREKGKKEAEKRRKKDKGD